MATRTHTNACRQGQHSVCGGAIYGSQSNPCQCDCHRQQQSPADTFPRHVLYWFPNRDPDARCPQPVILSIHETEQEACQTRDSRGLTVTQGHVMAEYMFRYLFPSVPVEAPQQDQPEAQREPDQTIIWQAEAGSPSLDQMLDQAWAEAEEQQQDSPPRPDFTAMAVWPW